MNPSPAKIALALLSVLIISLLSTPSFCEIQTITHTVKQPFGGSQSADDARISAIAKAKREALEMAGVYVEALTIVKDAKVDKDEILALAAGVLKSEVVSQENYHTKDAFGIDVVVRIVVDTSVLEGRVKKLLQDRTHLDQLNQARKKEKELLDKMAILEKENQRLMGKKESSKDLKKQFQETSQGLTAVEWFYKVVALWDGEKLTDPIKAIEYLNNAIKLQPDYATAYHIRGIVYSALGQDQRAIEDYNEAIRLKPDYAKAYYSRGLAYTKLARFHDAVDTYRQALRINPEYADAWNNLVIAYVFTGNKTAALDAVRELRRFDPATADEFFNLIMSR